MRYLFFSGKGGVGKTSLASATAVRLADSGLRTLLVTTDPASKLADVFEQQIGPKPVPIAAVARLDGQEIDAADAARTYRDKALGPLRGLLPDEMLRTMDEQMSGPCTVEIAGFDEFVASMFREEYDVIVFDTAPTGHTLRLLELPSAWSVHIEESAQGSGQTCIGPVDQLQTSKEKYDRAMSLLRDGAATHFVFVAQPERTSVAETRRASGELKELGIRNQRLIVNGVIPAEAAEHPFFDDFWASKAATDLEAVEVPAYVVACWADQGLHLRGTLEGYERISSEHKWLEVHGRKKWAYYYDPASVERLCAFFDHFLLGKDSPVTSWPKVRLELRERYFVGDMRAEEEWPIARTEYTPLYLTDEGALSRAAPQASGSVRYDALGGGPGAHRAVFEVAFDEATELVGHAKACLYMSAEGADDMDVFVGLYKFDAAGAHVPLAYYTFFDDGPVALGWLRASHRELDEKASTEARPVHTHARALPLAEGEVVRLDVEIWPSGTRFEAGERLRLIVQGSDLQKYSKTLDPIYTRHEDGVNAGRHVLHLGGEHASHLLVPVVRPREATRAG